ncbi:hypothetical protein B0H14DRAFT_2657355 [Mycena olivaceomarginata]|nr:hypothetical protein B0H14DRAFT_2657355 [Mycena olivaceomarginata]
MSAFPRWRNLNHFDAVMNKSFNDGSKHEDIAKTMLFVAQNVLVDDAGLLLLQALRSYLECRIYLSLEVHTSETIADGTREVLTLDAVMELVKHNHRVVATFIQEQIDAFNEDPDNPIESPKDLEASVLSNVDIASRLKPVFFLTLEQEMPPDPAFERFRIKFGEFLSDFLPAYG